MKRSHKIAAGIAVSLSLGLATAAFAQMGGGAGPYMRGGMQYGMMGGMGPGAMAGSGGGHGMQLMSPEERTAFREKMRNATPEERQKLAEATRADMQKRAQEKGITLREGRGPGAGPCWTSAAAPQAPGQAQ